jgi:exopolyphosphatase/guanosine-5'-triphosphate,3'-diphosphate pyrophosphatase
VIDLGSNSWRLVVFSYLPGVWWRRTDELYEAVRLGAGLAATGKLSEQAIARGLETLAVFDRFLHSSGISAEHVRPVATSAIRDAANGDELVGRATRATDLPIEVISAQEEARYGYVAAVNSTTLRDGLVLDLGGGSLQLVPVRERKPIALHSWPLGALRVTERFLEGSEPASRKQLARGREGIRSELGDALRLEDLNGELVGIGGSVRNLAAASQRLRGLPTFSIQGFLLSAEGLDELVQELAGRSATERGQLAGIKPARGEIILGAALVLQTVIELGGYAGIRVTEAGLREGVFLSSFLAPTDPPLISDVRRASVENLALQYEVDIRHVEHVARLSTQIHESLERAGLLRSQPGERELLWAAAMLHDVGMAIDYDDHHKHSQYLIRSIGLPGFDPRELGVIAQIARYHRKGEPSLDDVEGLAHDGDEEIVRRGAVIVRLAEHLERGRDQSIQEVSLTPNGAGVELYLHATGDPTVARWSVERYADDRAFDEVFGRGLVVG